MKRLTLVLTTLALIAAPLLAGAYLEYFQGHSDGDNVVLEWKTRTESSLATFEILRKAGQNGEYVTIGSIDPRGSNSSYTFVDRSAYKDAGSVYVYRLKIVEAGGQTSWSNEVTISHNVSSVKRTWGSIKAMFR